MEKWRATKYTTITAGNFGADMDIEELLIFCLTEVVIYFVLTVRKWP
jgi:hypothetical protein